jgi:exoribonuclease R
MEYYNYIYGNNIAPLYGSKRNQTIDKELIKTNILPHEYSIKERTDLTHLQVYSIDPEGCQDADDAFSIYREDDKLFLAIHIADPTEEINIRCTLWQDITNKIITRYPSHMEPIHMMPKEIMDAASLMVNSYGDVKMAITIQTEIDKTTFYPINNVKLLYSKIKVKQANALSYKKAGSLYYSLDVLNNGLKISNSMKTARSKETKGVVLNEISNSYTKIENNEMFLYHDEESEILMKQMIAEFAIFANSFIGEYLKVNFKGRGIYRSCNAKEWLADVYMNISGKELLNEIIVNGIKADYVSKVASHDLVGAPEYCHFTSPIRRVSDCVCHYLLKYIYLKDQNHSIEVPFTDKQLLDYSNSCVKLTKLMKNVQYKDVKFRLIQTMDTMLKNKETIQLGFFITSYTGLFLNIIINSINKHSVYISYTLRIPNLQIDYESKKTNYILITKVKCMGKFDQGSIPELDNLFL